LDSSQFGQPDFRMLEPKSAWSDEDFGLANDALFLPLVSFDGMKTFDADAYQGSVDLLWFSAARATNEVIRLCHTRKAFYMLGFV
jgi:hypothetical protein